MRPSGPKQPQIYTHDFSEFMNNKKRQTVEGLGRQHQGMDRPWVRQDPESNGGQRKREETGWSGIVEGEGEITQLEVWNYYCVLCDFVVSSQVWVYA